MTTETKTSKQKIHSYNGGNGEKSRCMRKFAAVVVTAFMLIVTAGCADGGGSTGGVAADGELMVHYLDVGQADSTLLVSGDEAMLIDTGNRDDADYILSYLDELGIDELE